MAERITARDAMTAVEQHRAQMDSVIRGIEGQMSEMTQCIRALMIEQKSMVEMMRENQRQGARPASTESERTQSDVRREPGQQSGARRDRGLAGHTTMEGRTLKMDFPRFSGDDPLSWVFRVEQYFDCQGIEGDERVQQATVYFEGAAVRWFRWLVSRQGRPDWATFVRELTIRFGPCPFPVNPNFTNQESTTIERERKRQAAEGTEYTPRVRISDMEMASTAGFVGRRFCKSVSAEGWAKMKTILASQTRDISEEVTVTVKAKFVKVEGQRCGEQVKPKDNPTLRMDERMRIAISEPTIAGEEDETMSDHTAAQSTPKDGEILARAVVQIDELQQEQELSACEQKWKQKVTLYNTDPNVVQAFSGSDIKIFVSLPNGQLLEVSASSWTDYSWVQKKVAAYPSSGGSFRRNLVERTVKPMLKFLRQTGSFLMVNQLVQYVQKCQAYVSESGSSGLSTKDLQSNGNLFIQAVHQLPRILEMQADDELGIPKRYTWCLKIAEVVNSRKNLVDFSGEQTVAGADEQFVHHGDGLCDSSTPEQAVLGAYAIPSARTVLRQFPLDSYVFSSFLIGILGCSHQETLKVRKAISELFVEYNIQFSGLYKTIHSTLEEALEGLHLEELISKINSMIFAVNDHWRYSLMANRVLLLLLTILALNVLLQKSPHRLSQEKKLTGENLKSPLEDALIQVFYETDAAVRFGIEDHLLDSFTILARDGNGSFPCPSRHFPSCKVKVEFPVPVDVGGWSDATPWSLERSGCVLNKAILLKYSLSVGVQIETEPTGGIWISEDAANQVFIDDATSVSAPFHLEDPFRLVKSALLVTCFVQNKVVPGLGTITWTNVPSGSGLVTLHLNLINWKFVKACDENCTHQKAIYIRREGSLVFVNSMSQLEIGDVVHRSIKEGNMVLVNGLPSVHQHSLIAFVSVIASVELPELMALDRPLLNRFLHPQVTIPLGQLAETQRVANHPTEYTELITCKKGNPGIHGGTDQGVKSQVLKGDDGSDYCRATYLFTYVVISCIMSAVAVTTYIWVMQHKLAGMDSSHPAATPTPPLMPITPTCLLKVGVISAIKRVLVHVVDNLATASECSFIRMLRSIKLIRELQS